MGPQQAHAATPGELAVELVREKLYRRLNQELPYRLSVVLQSVAPDARDTRHPQALVIKVDVFVKNRLTKSIVVGKGGSVIQRYVAEPTQAELARALGVPVQLLVFVKTLSA
jgi:GTP-binding protein Era